MVKETHFPNAPIVEALLDIRVNLPGEVNLEALASFQQKIKREFPVAKERIKWQGEFQVRPGEVPAITSHLGGADGYLFCSDDEKKIVQARLDGFTFNKLRPYTKWKIFSDEAKGLWEHYIQIAKPISVTRLALRYINRIEIPLPFKDFKEYILTIPEICPGIPNALSEFFTRLVIPNTEIQATAIITETMEKIGDKANILPFIFDIDVFKDVVLDPRSDDIWKILDELRQFKNQIFLNSITEKTKELFK